MNIGKTLIGTTLFFSSLVSFGQNVGINETGVAGDPSAGLDVDFTDKGVLIPRMALTQTTSAAPVAAPVNSLLVFNTATVNDVTPGYYYWFGGQWVRIGEGSGYWDRNVANGYLFPSTLTDQVGIGTNTPIAKLDVDHNVENIAVRGEGQFGPTNGYLGVQGANSFDGVTTLNTNGNEIGVLGLSTGGSSTDNFGVYGHSNGWGGRFEYEDGSNFVNIGGNAYAIQIVDGTEGTDRVLTSDANGNGTWQDISTFYDDEDWEVNGNDVYTGHGGNYPSGNVGVGTTAPVAKLDVRGGNFFFNDDGNDNDVRMETLNNDYAFYLDASKDVLFVGDNFGDYQNGNTIDGEVVDYVANFDNGNVSGTAIGIGSIEYLLDRSGETTINNRFSPSTDGGEDLGGFARRWDEVFAQNGTINTSDRRDKKDIENLNYGLKELMQLKPVSFNWKDHLSSPDQSGVKKLGLIAQDLHEIIPEVVKTKDYVKIGENPDTDEPIKEVQEAKRWGVFYSDLIPVLIKGIQEQQEIIDEQEETIEDLEGKYQDLKNEIELIKKQLE